MARRSDYYDPTGLWHRDSPGLEQWGGRAGNVVRLKAAYVRIQEPGRYRWNPSQREYLLVRGSRTDRRELVGYWSPLTGELWSEEVLRATWLAMMTGCGYVQGATLAERLEGPAFVPLRRPEGEQPPAFWASRCLWKREGAAMAREEAGR